MLKLVLRNMKPTAERPTTRYLCFAPEFRQGVYQLTESYPWNAAINFSIVLASAILLLPTQLWPAKVYHSIIVL